ncbi:hypothetical protein [Sphingomonas xinjiangensis]|uniref:Uncharacterized protein n=1 Tax=Sphingomonas xinjiangensis TaxID=643568 RepID=A0A840YNU9_9SPHN|nr:hypothetical protein [Sphingomonas xinjiangensis]MBB5712066.1 hypothetical protein [Sphingomonas xinjiangensis]
MLALNDTTEAIVERFGALAFRLIEEEVIRAIARNDDDAAAVWKAKLIEVNSLSAAPGPAPSSENYHSSDGRTDS